MGGPARILLVVDDIPAMGHALQRSLSKSFDKIVLAESAEQAELLLASEQSRPTHLLCDDNLGLDSPRGVELVGRWRRAHSGIESAALITGNDEVEPSPGRGIDRVFRKPLDISELREFFASRR